MDEQIIIAHYARHMPVSQIARALDIDAAYVYEVIRATWAAGPASTTASILANILKENNDGTTRKQNQGKPARTGDADE